MKHLMAAARFTEHLPCCLICIIRTKYKNSNQIIIPLITHLACSSCWRIVSILPRALFNSCSARLSSGVRDLSTSDFICMFCTAAALCTSWASRVLISWSLAAIVCVLLGVVEQSLNDCSYNRTSLWVKRKKNMDFLSSLARDNF